MIRNGKRHPHEILIDQGTADEFLQSQLRTADFESACSKSGQSVTVNLREGYDHSYYFIATYIESHIAFHASAMR